MSIISRTERPPEPAPAPATRAGRLLAYISPQILPVLPRTEAETVVGFDIQRILDQCAVLPDEVTLELDIALFAKGRELLRVGETVRVTRGRADLPLYSRTFASDELGYMEIALRSSVPVFHRLHVEPGYAILRTPGGDWSTVIFDAKYARPLIIDSVRSTAKFCAVHAAAHVDAAHGHGDSHLAVNPYGRDVIAQFVVPSGRAIKRRVPPRHAVMIPLEPLIGTSGWDCVMVTGNNRFPLWDVRHAYGNPYRIFSIDHLDMFRGSATHLPIRPVECVRKSVRTALREHGIRLS